MNGKPKKKCAERKLLKELLRQELDARRIK